MDFEEALVNELNSITDLNGKVFPLLATEGIKAPYVVYVSSEGTEEKTLTGYVVTTREVECEINVMHTSYYNLKQLTKQVLDLLKSFEGRTIGGTGGLFIKEMTYEKPLEIYEYEILEYRSAIPITIKF